MIWPFNKKVCPECGVVFKPKGGDYEAEFNEYCSAHAKSKWDERCATRKFWEGCSHHRVVVGRLIQELDNLIHLGVRPRTYLCYNPDEIAIDVKYKGMSVEECLRNDSYKHI